MKIFGFEIKKQANQQSDTNNLLSDLSSANNKYNVIDTVVTPENEDGSIDITSLYNSYQLASFTNQSTTEQDLIKQYREIATQPEVDQAIDEIINEAIVLEDNFEVVKLNLDNLDYSDRIKQKIRDEFDQIIHLLNFNTDAYNIFRKWYIDGRLYYNIVIDFENTKMGIQKLLPISPFNIKKIREIVKERNENNVEVIKDIKEYYVYDEISNFTGQALKIPTDSICYVHSGLLDETNHMVLSYLNKVIKSINQLRMMEDALIIYRLARAPERRVFYVDVGNLSKIKGEQYIKSLMAKFKNKMVYDAVTGSVKDSRNQLSMMEDFWIPRRSEGKTTEIQTLPGACLDMSTLVRLLDGRTLSIKEIADEMLTGKTLWTYSANPETGEIVPGLISWAGVTRKNAKVVRLTLDNNKTIICTPDHKFPILGKGKVEAKDLSIGESFIPFYTKHDLVSIEFLDEPMDVGTLTIDNQEIYHNYHTFALDVGIFVCNSNTDNTAEVNYFLNRMYNSLNIPAARFSTDSAATVSLGRTAEITRDELKFTKFIRRLQAQFSNLFYILLRIQLLLKNIITLDDWDDIKNDIKFVYEKDNYYTDTKNAAILKDKLEMLASIDPYVGKYLSREFVYKNVLNMGEEEIHLNEKEMKKEADKSSSSSDDNESEPVSSDDDNVPYSTEEEGGEEETPDQGQKEDMNSSSSDEQSSTVKSPIVAKTKPLPLISNKKEIVKNKKEEPSDVDLMMQGLGS